MAQATQHRTRTSRTVSRRLTWRPTLEALEDRCLLAVGLDPTFNGAGTQTLAFPGGSVTATAVAVQPDSKIVVAGTFTASGTPAASDFAIVRFDANGSLDTTFGSGGRVTLDFGLTGSNQQATAVAIQADGKIVVGGSVATNGTGAWDFALARLTAAGALDSTFGSGGEETLDFGADDFLTGLVLQPADGKIVVAGHSDQATTASFVAARLNTDGSLDTSFGSGGKQTISFGAFDVANAVTLQPDGKIVLAGSTGTSSSPSEVAVARLTSAGMLDASFGSGGKATINAAAPTPAFLNYSTEGRAVTVQPDGKILVAGNFLPPSGTFPTAFVLRLNADGSQDTSFARDPVTGASTNGTAYTFFNAPDLPLGSHPSQTATATGVAVDASNRIIVTATVTVTDAFVQGTSGPFYAYEIFQPDGSTLVTNNPSASSGTVGFGGSDTQANALALAPGGTMVLAGSTTPQSSPSSMAVARVVLPPPPQTTTVATFDPTTATWYLRNSNTPGAPDVTPFAYGVPGWIPVVGDWDGNGTATVGVFDPSTATWYLKNSNAPGAPDITPFQYGEPGWIPVVGDWNGTGHTGIGVVDPSTNTWYLRSTASPGAPTIAPFQYGAPGWIPVAGDWKGIGTFTPGVFDPSTATWYLATPFGPTPFAYGLGSDKPVVGDWNGDGVWTVGVYDPSGNGTWLLRNSNSAGAPDVAPFAYGAPNWTPLSGFFNAAPQLQLAAAGEGPGAASITTSQLNGIMTAALDRLAAAGVAPATQALLANVTATVQPLPPGYLGLAYQQEHRIVLDDDGAGWGWFVDPTPMQDEEYVGGQALLGSAAASHPDLLTTVLHELGHIAGLADDDGSGLMAEALPLGTRRTDHLDAVFASAGMVSP